MGPNLKKKKTTTVKSAIEVPQQGNVHTHYHSLAIHF